MKIAVAGKGGAGKTTVAASLAVLFARDGKKVIAVDADPSPNLAIPLGVPAGKRESIVPISRMLELIEDRTGVKPGDSFGKMFVMNPKVDDLADRFGVECILGINLLVLGAVSSGGSGCFCPENALLRSIMRHLVLKKGEVVIMDMEAGVEHLGRSTAENVDCLVVVIEPSVKSVEIAARIKKLAGDIGIKKTAAVLNKCSRDEERALAESELKKHGLPLIGAIPADDCIPKADFEGRSPFVNGGCEHFLRSVSVIKRKIEGSIR